MDVGLPVGSGVVDAGGGEASGVGETGADVVSDGLAAAALAVEFVPLVAAEFGPAHDVSSRAASSTGAR